MALLKIAAKKYIQRVSVIWSSPLLDWNKVKSTNEFALSTFVYLMWTQRWPLAKLRKIDQRLRKIIVANGGRHPTSSNSTLLLSRSIGGRGLRSVEQEYKVCCHHDQLLLPRCFWMDGDGRGNAVLESCQSIQCHYKQEIFLWICLG